MMTILFLMDLNFSVELDKNIKAFANTHVGCYNNTACLAHILRMREACIKSDERRCIDAYVQPIG